MRLFMKGENRKEVRIEFERVLRFGGWVEEEEWVKSRKRWY